MYDLIGFAGPAGCGKDTAAGYVSRVWGHRRYAFADPMRAVISKLYGIPNELWNDRVWKDTDVHTFGLNQPTGFPITPRQFLQWFGTEAGRELHGENCWVDLMEREYRQYRRLVVSDVRFKNELSRIRKLGGVCILIKRDVDPVSRHSSESSRPEDKAFDAVINNDADVATLIGRIDETLRWLWDNDNEYLQTTYGEIAQP